MDPQTPLQEISGIGPKYLSLLQRLQISTAMDLITHYPFRYEDLSQIKKIAELAEGEVVTVRGSIWEIDNIKTRTGKFLTKALINDGSGSIAAVWFNQPYLTKTIKVGQNISLAGKVALFNYRLSLTSPDYEIFHRGRHTGRLVPIYPETEGLSSKWLRNKIESILPEVLDELIDPLPDSIRKTHGLVDFAQALRWIHHPADILEVEQAQKRLAFEEMFVLNLASLIRKSFWQSGQAVPVHFNRQKIDSFISTLPFKLTGAQKRVLEEILTDLNSKNPMNRLLQGDVGSGKTVVAAIAAYAAWMEGKKTLLMAPTSILADQHLQTLTTLLEPTGMKIAIRTAAKKSDSGDVIVGTQALLAESFNASDVALVVIDEQHRFGVAQRSKLRDKGGNTPHLLSMTATPIPRTLALSLYADLDLSVIDELPPGRKGVKTYLTPPEKRTAAYEFIREKIKAGQQAFIVTPLIEPSESLSTLRSAKEEFVRLQGEVFPDLRLGLLHGRMKPKEKDKALDLFRDKKLDILVSTPVVEVGIDVPNATVMLIEGSERFGLAALHQLRGRIGRGSEESWCLLFSDDPNPETRNRLSHLQTHQSGAELAELDLRLRGSGELYGLRQSGLPQFRFASLSDTKLIKKTRSAAEAYLSSKPSIPPSLTSKLEPLLSNQVSPD